MLVAFDADLASGIVNTSLQVSTAIGVAVLSSLSSDRTRALIGRGAAHGQALLGGYQLAFAVGLATWSPRWSGCTHHGPVVARPGAAAAPTAEAA